MIHSVLIWLGFILFIISLLALDLGVFRRQQSETVQIKQSLLLTAFWISSALIFNLGIYWFKGQKPALEFLTGYLLEESLSIDNLFVFLIIFSYFRVPPRYQHQVLFWGILGAILMRFLFIVLGIALIRKFDFIIYVFGALLVYTGVKMVQQEEDEVHPEKNPVLKFVRRFLPVTEDYEGNKFFVKRAGKLFATPLFIVLLMVETTDVIFATDSIPAIFGVTLNPFIVYTSNIFAILGLRSLYFVLSGIMDRFHYLSYGLSLILVFIGVKMLISGFFHIPIGVTLGFIALVLIASIVLSLRFPPKN